MRRDANILYNTICGLNDCYVKFMSFKNEKDVLECLKEESNKRGVRNVINVGFLDADEDDIFPLPFSTPLSDINCISGQLFDFSLSKYITGISFTPVIMETLTYKCNEISVPTKFNIGFVVKDLDKENKDTNIGPDLIEYIESLF